MTSADLKRLRLAHGMSQAEWGRFLGYTGKHVRRQISRYESEERELPPRLILKLQSISAQMPSRKRSAARGQTKRFRAVG